MRTSVDNWIAGNCDFASGMGIAGEWVCDNCRFAGTTVMAGMVDELAYQGYGDAQKIVEIAKSRPVVAWVLKMMEQGIPLDDIAQYKKDFDRFKKDRLNEKTDVTSVTHDEIRGLLDSNEYQQERESMFAKVATFGIYEIWRGDSPEAISKLCAIPEYGTNRWCTKGKDWADMYSGYGRGEPFYAILRNGQFFAAKVGKTIVDAGDRLIYNMDMWPKDEKKDFLDAIKFTVSDSGGKWHDSHEFRFFRETFARQAIDDGNYSEFAEIATPGLNSDVISHEFSKELMEKYKGMPPAEKRKMGQAMEQVLQYKLSRNIIDLLNRKWKDTVKDVRSSFIGNWPAMRGIAGRAFAKAVDALAQDGMLTIYRSGKPMYPVMGFDRNLVWPGEKLSPDMFLHRGNHYIYAKGGRTTE
jgi:hypothetical protein